MKTKFKILKSLNALPKHTNVDFYDGDYGKMLDERFINVPRIPRVLLIGNPDNVHTKKFKSSQAVFSFTNFGIGMTVDKKKHNEFYDVSYLHLRNTYKYGVFKIWFSLPIGKNLEFKIYTIGADGNPSSTIFKHNTQSPNKATQEIIRGYPGQIDVEVIKMPEINYKGLLTETAICAEVEFSPFETIFRFNGLETSRSKMTLDNQQKLLISLLPFEDGDVEVIKEAFLKRITVENKFKKSII